MSSPIANELETEILLQDRLDSPAHAAPTKSQVPRSLGDGDIVLAPKTSKNNSRVAGKTEKNDIKDIKDIKDSKDSKDSEDSNIQDASTSVLTHGAYHSSHGYLRPPTMPLPSAAVTTSVRDARSSANITTVGDSVTTLSRRMLHGLEEAQLPRQPAAIMGSPVARCSPCTIVPVPIPAAGDSSARMKLLVVALPMPVKKGYQIDLAQAVRVSNSENVPGSGGGTAKIEQPNRTAGDPSPNSCLDAGRSASPRAALASSTTATP